MKNQPGRVEGSGQLVLSRKVGQRIMISADRDASDAEIAAAVRHGMIISVVDIVAPYSNAHKTRGSTRIGLKASSILHFTREELLAEDEMPQIAQASA